MKRAGNPNGEIKIYINGWTDRQRDAGQCLMPHYAAEHHITNINISETNSTSFYTANIFIFIFICFNVK